MNVCWVSDHIVEKTAKRFEITYFQNKCRLKSGISQRDGAWRVQILSIDLSNGNPSIVLANRAFNKFVNTLG